MLNIRELLKDGLGGTLAMTTQISIFYWLKTTTTYQYKNGIGTFEAFSRLYNNGGVKRFYSGFIPSLLLGNTCKFGDVVFYKYLEKQENLSSIQKSYYASTLSTAWRINLLPLDTLDLMLQSHGKKGFNILKQKVIDNNLMVLYNGGIASSLNNFVGYIGWFYTYSELERYRKEKNIESQCFNVLEGVTCAVVSDTITNPIKVLKTYRQTSPKEYSYITSLNILIKQKGYLNIIFRGLETRLLMNCLQNSLFVILWKEFDKIIES